MDPTLLQTIGNTPLVRLQKLSPAPGVAIYAKLEFFNPSGSIKDRIVHYILEDAERRSLLKAGGTVVENTSGNTGAAAAMIAALKGFRCILTMPDKVSREKQNALTAYGAEVVVCPTAAPPDSPDHYVNRAKKLAEEIPGSFRINQYDNPLNAEAHYKTTGPEIWEQMEGKIDLFIASSSTGGSVSGIARYLKEQDPKIRVVVPDPVGSIFYDYFKTGELPKSEGCSYLVEGIGEDHLTGAMDFSLVDEMLQFSDSEAFGVARRLAKEEGILAGGSGGANVWAALQFAEAAGRPLRIATLIPDGGIKYLSKIFNDEWMEEHELLDASHT